MPYDDITDEFYLEESTPGTTAEVRLKIAGIGVAPLTEAIVARIARERAPQIEKLLAAAIEAKVRELVDDAATVKIGDVVEGVLREGFQQTNTYGSPSGPRLTLKEMILKLLAGDQYNRSNLPSIVSDVVQKRFEPEITAATKEIRGMVDGEIKERLNKALREALGQK